MGEVSYNLGDEFSYVNLFRVESIPDQLAEISKFITTEHAPAQHHQLLTCSDDYQLIVG
jgi:hypothetical protein